ncbi:MAG: hypothetical protein U1E60_11670 [Reyranellaceae bacterium]
MSAALLEVDGVSRLYSSGALFGRRRVVVVANVCLRLDAAKPDVSDRIMIMCKGEVVESSEARAVLDNPQHPYSQRLKSSVLSPDVPSNRVPSSGAASHA